MEPLARPAQAGAQFDDGAEPALARPRAQQGYPREFAMVGCGQRARLFEDDSCMRGGDFSFLNRFKDLPLTRGELRSVIQGLCCGSFRNSTGCSHLRNREGVGLVSAKPHGLAAIAGPHLLGNRFFDPGYGPHPHGGGPGNKPVGRLCQPKSFISSQEGGQRIADFTAEKRPAVRKPDSRKPDVVSCQFRLHVRPFPLVSLVSFSADYSLGRGSDNFGGTYRTCSHTVSAA